MNTIVGKANGISPVTLMSENVHLKRSKRAKHTYCFMSDFPLYPYMMQLWSSDQLQNHCHAIFTYILFL